MSFITWKGWKSTFGRWNLWIVVAIHAVCGYGFVVAGHWAGYAFAGAVIAALWIGGRINFRALKKIDHKHPNNHRVDICEGCDPVCYAKDGAPLSWTDWFTHFRPQGTVSEMAKEYDAYLSHRKFRNYPKPA